MVLQTRKSINFHKTLCIQYFMKWNVLTNISHFQYQLYRNQYLKLIGDHAKIQHIKCGRSGLTQIYVSTMFLYLFFFLLTCCLWKCNYWLKISSLTQFLFHFISLQVCEAFERLRYLKKTLNLVRNMFLS